MKQIYALIIFSLIIVSFDNVNAQTQAPGAPVKTDANGRPYEFHTHMRSIEDIDKNKQEQEKKSEGTKVFIGKQPEAQPKEEEKKKKPAPKN